jgi:hypothetical protein
MYRRTVAQSFLANRLREEIAESRGIGRSLGRIPEAYDAGVLEMSGPFKKEIRASVEA